MANRLNLFLFGALVAFAVAREVPADEATPSRAIAALPAGTNVSDPGAATKAWLDSVPADKRASSDAYFEGGYWLILWNFLLSAAIMVFLLRSGISVRLRNFAERKTHFRALQTVLYGIPLFLILVFLSFPLDVYQSFFRDHSYGLSTQSFASWLQDQAIETGVALVALNILLIALYAVFRHARRSWWLWAVGVVTLFHMTALLISPIYIAPLTNKYRPLADPVIRDSILQMARANEIPVNQVYEFDASRQTNRISANVSGFLGTTRISLNDNLLKECSLPEIRAVMAHEMGHYVLNHGAKLVLYAAVMSLIMFGLLFVIFNWVIHRWGDSLQLRGISDLAALPLLALILTTLTFLLTPISNSIGRITEREADAFGINTAREPDGAASVALKLGSYRKLDPGPLEEFIFFDHPSGRARIRMAMDWKAANLPVGESKP